MKDQSKTKQALIQELVSLRERIAELDQSKAERKRTEEELRESEEKYRNILENIEEGYFEVDLAGNMKFFNPSLCRILGYPKEEMLGMNNRVYMDAENAKKVFHAFNEVYETGIPTKEFEWETIRRDGARTHMEVSVSLIAKPGKKPTGFRGIARDVTERKKAEEEERWNREEAERMAGEMAVIAEMGRVIGSTLDIDEVYERFATEARKLIPFDRVSVNLINPDGKSFTNAYVSGLDVPDRRPGTIVPIAGSVSEIFMQRQSGLIIHVESPEDLVRQFPGVTVSLVVGAGIRSLIGVPLIYRNEVIGSLHFRAIKPDAYTDRDLRLAERIGAQIAGAIANAHLFIELKKTERSLRESEGRFRALVEQAAVGVAEIEMSTGRFFTVNRRLCEMVGRTEEEMLAITFQAITHPEDLHLHEGKTALMLAGQIRHYSLEKRYLRKDGEIVWVNITVSPLWKPGENPERNIAVVEDITDRKRMMEESDRHSRQLAMLHETSVELMAELNLEALLQSIAQRSLDLIGGTASNVYIYRPEEDLMDRVVSVGPTLIPSKTTRRRGEGMVGQTWAKGAPMLINDYHAWPGRTKATDSYPSRALIAVPFCQGTEILGIINIMANLPHQYTQTDVDMLSMFAMQAAIAIRNTRLYDRMKIELAERKRVEEAMSESEERYRALVDNASDIVFTTDNTGHFTFVNPAGIRIVGYETEEIIGRHYPTLIRPDMREEAMKFFGIQFVKGLQNTYSEYPMITKEGDEIWLGQNTKLIVQDGHVEGFHAMARDITARKRVEDELRRNQDVAELLAQEMAIIAEIGKVIGSSVDVNEVYERFAAEVRKLIPFDRLAVNLHNHHEENVRVAYVFGKALPGRSKGALFPLKGSISEVLIKTRAGLYSHPKNVEEMVQRFPNHAATVQAGMRSLMGVPLIYRDEVIASLHFRSKTPNAYTDRDLHLAERIGAQIAGAIGTAKLFSDLKRMEEEIREMSLRDQMTDLYNRRGFITLAEQQIRAANRAKRAMLLTFVDLDGLKGINDTLGHEEGDRALIDTANVLRQTFRESDVIARLGGDEFAILSIDAADINPEDISKRLQQNIDAGNAKETRPYMLAMSWGTAVYNPESPVSLDELMFSADERMYARKKAKTNHRI